MTIIKHGDIEKRRGEFHFVCERCGCEWEASRGDTGLSFSPPCVKFYAIMKCPDCGNTAYDR